jgi:hypothetical protein
MPGAGVRFRSRLRPSVRCAPRRRCDHPGAPTQRTPKVANQIPFAATARGNNADDTSLASSDPSPAPGGRTSERSAFHHFWPWRAAASTGQIIRSQSIALPAEHGGVSPPVRQRSPGRSTPRPAYGRRSRAAHGDDVPIVRPVSGGALAQRRRTRRLDSAERVRNLPVKRVPDLRRRVRYHASLNARRAGFQSIRQAPFLVQPSVRRAVSGNARPLSLRSRPPSAWSKCRTRRISTADNARGITRLAGPQCCCTSALLLCVVTRLGEPTRSRPGRRAIIEHRYGECRSLVNASGVRTSERTDERV